MHTLQSHLFNRYQNPDERRGDDPERQRAPPALAALGPAHRRDGLRRQPHAVPGHGLELLQHGYRSRSDRRKARRHAAELTGAGHRALDASHRAEIALDPFANYGIGDLPDVEFWIDAARRASDHG